MNGKTIGFCSLVTALAGATIGVAVAEISPIEFESRIYQDVHGKYAIAGAVIGATFGASQDALRQLKAQRQREWQDDR